MRRLIGLLAMATSLTAVAPSGASAASVDVTIGGNSFGVEAGTSLLKLVPVLGLRLDGGYLYGGQTTGDHLNMGYGDLMVTGNADSLGNFSGGLGIRPFYADRQGYSGGGAAFGGRLRYRIPHMNRLSVAGELFYAPDTLISGDYSRYLQYGADLDFQVLRVASIYGGWRRVALPIDDDNSGRSDTAQVGWHVGLQARF